MLLFGLKQSELIQMIWKDSKLEILINLKKFVFLYDEKVTY